MCDSIDEKVENIMGIIWEGIKVIFLTVISIIIVFIFLGVIYSCISNVVIENYEEETIKQGYVVINNKKYGLKDPNAVYVNKNWIPINDSNRDLLLK